MVRILKILNDRLGRDRAVPRGSGRLTDSGADVSSQRCGERGPVAADSMDDGCRGAGVRELFLGTSVGGEGSARLAADAADFLSGADGTAGESDRVRAHLGAGWRGVALHRFDVHRRVADGDADVSSQRCGECGSVAANSVDDGCRGADVRAVPGDVGGREGSARLAADAADFLSGADGTAGESDRVRAHLGAGRRGVALHRFDVHRRLADRDADVSSQRRGECGSVAANSVDDGRRGAGIRAVPRDVGGRKDLRDSRQTQQTSYLVPTALPTNQTVYARIWVQVGGVWRYTDSTFTVASQTATLTYPANGAVNADLSQPIQWTTVAGAQAYVLWIGTSLGANNLVATPEIAQTSYLATGLPSGQTLYARIRVQVGGVWRWTDSTFGAATQVPALTFPANGAANADLSQPVQWTTVVGAQAYQLYLGSTVGAKDILDSRQTQATSFLARNVPPNRTLYARVWAQVGGVWRWTDSTFSAATQVPALTFPANGAANADLSQPVQWTTVVGAQAYQLYLGSAVGAKDILDSRQTQAASFLAANIPPNQTVYARIWAKVGGVWRYADSTFSVAPTVAEFLYPLDGGMSVDPGQPFSWTAAVHAQGYEVWVGSAPGSNDIYDSGEVAGTSVGVTSLPLTGPLYARVWTKSGGAWARHSDIAFSIESSAAASTILGPADGSTTFDTARPFKWSAVALARGYRLTIGTTSGGSDLHDSGEIHVTQRFVPGLPVGIPLFGRLQTKIGGQWHATDFGFSAAANTASATYQIKAALWATSFVRTMAFDADNRPSGGSKLWDDIWPRYSADCEDYSATLFQILGEINLAFPARRLNVAFTANHLDAHTLVEILDSSTGKWILLDPTFDLSVMRSNGEWATAEDVSAATLGSSWNDVSYVFLGAAGDSYVRNFGLDYPLLFANVYHQGELLFPGEGNSALPYLEEVSIPVSGSAQFYMIRCTESTSVEAIVDGTLRTVACPGRDSLSSLIMAGSVASPEGSSFRLYQPYRFVF